MLASTHVRLLVLVAIGAGVAASCSSSHDKGGSGGASSTGGGGASTGSSGGGTTSASAAGGAGAGGAGGGGAATGGAGGSGGAPNLDACDETQTSDIPGVTRQCKGDVFDDFSCDTGLDPCGFTAPVTEFFNVYGLTPWYGEYGGQVTTAGTVLPVTPGSDFFGAKYALGEGMDYSGATETVCLANTSKYVALRLVPNTAATIRLSSNASFELVRQFSVSTQPGQFTDGNPAVVCKTASVGSAALELTTNGTQGAKCVLEIGKSYWVNYYDGGAPANPNDPRCKNGYGGSFSYGIING